MIKEYIITVSNDLQCNLYYTAKNRGGVKLFLWQYVSFSLFQFLLVTCSIIAQQIALAERNFEPTTWAKDVRQVQACDSTRSACSHKKNKPEPMEWVTEGGGLCSGMLAGSKRPVIQHPALAANP